MTASWLAIALFEHADTCTHRQTDNPKTYCLQPHLLGEQRHKNALIWLCLHVQNVTDVILTLAALWCEGIVSDCTFGTPGATDATWTITISSHLMTTDIAGVCTVTWNAAGSHVVIARLQSINNSCSKLTGIARNKSTH